VSLAEQSSLRATVTGEFDKVVYLRRVCGAPATELGCVDDWEDPAEVLEHPHLDPGDYYLFVDGFADAAGAYEVTLSAGDPFFPPPNDTCGDAIVLQPGEEVEGTTRLATDDYHSSCTRRGHAAPDVAYRFALGAVTRVVVTLEAERRAADGGNFDSVLYLRDDDCDRDTPPVRCVDEPEPQVIDAVLGAGDYWVIVDGWREGEGSFTLRFGTLPLGLPDGCAADCPRGFRCVDRECEAVEEPGGCENNADCGDGMVCQDDECEARPGGCLEDADCANGMVCQDGECEARPGGCADDADCANGTECVDGSCQEPVGEGGRDPGDFQDRSALVGHVPQAEGQAERDTCSRDGVEYGLSRDPNPQGDTETAWFWEGDRRTGSSDYTRESVVSPNGEQCSLGGAALVTPGCHAALVVDGRDGACVAPAYQVRFYGLDTGVRIGFAGLGHSCFLGRDPGGDAFGCPRLWFSPDGTVAALATVRAADSPEGTFQVTLLDLVGGQGRTFQGFALGALGGLRFVMAEGSLVRIKVNDEVRETWDLDQMRRRGSKGRARDAPRPGAGMARGARRVMAIAGMALLALSCTDVRSRAGQGDAGDAAGDGPQSECQGQLYLDAQGASRPEGERCLGRGRCPEGRVECLAGELRCSTLPGGSEDASEPEQCNGSDDDCDGMTDEDEGGEALREACYGGPAETPGVGPCRSGTRECVGGGWAPSCPGEVLPVTELCNGDDDDCDGETDEDFEVGRICGAGVGACLTAGRRVCLADGTGAECDAVPGEPTEEVCSGRDDDCDGEEDETDDGERITRPCYTGPEGTAGVGECREGGQRCRAGGWYESCDGEVHPAEEDEVCNGLDEDCDGETDNGTAPPGWTCVPPTGPDGFLMGSPEGEVGRDDDEVRHRVVITRPFLISRTEVTQAQWEAYMGSNPSWFREEGEGGCEGEPCGRRPVERVNRREAVVFCNAVSLDEGLEPCYYRGTGDLGPYDSQDAVRAAAPIWRDGLDCEGYRLPTEAEWEHAARAGTETAFWSGDLRLEDAGCVSLSEALDRAGWYCGNSDWRTHEVGTKPPNPWGLFDVHGNVREWVWDYEARYETLPAEDPTGGVLSSTPYNTARGGGWEDRALHCRLAERPELNPGHRYETAGLRLARSVAPREP